MDRKVANPPFVKGKKLKATRDTGFNPPDSERGCDSMYPDPTPTPALITVKIFESKASIIVTMIFIIVVTVITPLSGGGFVFLVGIIARPSRSPHTPPFLWQVTF